MELVSYASAVATELDRLVVSVHERVAAHPETPGIVERFGGDAGLVDVAGCVLTRRTLTLHELGLILPYTPTSMLRSVIENNVEAGLLEPEDGTPLRLTTSGREYARTVSALQEEIATTLWSGSATADATAATALGRRVIEDATQVTRPMMPAAFDLFAPIATRESAGAELLAVLRALRYWRADAHRLAWTEQDLQPLEAHALNHLWDEHRQVARKGQGAPQLATEGIPALVDRGLATEGRLQDKGLTLREEVEDTTNARNATIYAGLDRAALTTLLAALQNLPS